MKTRKKIVLGFFVVLFLAAASSAEALSLGHEESFYVDTGFDEEGREKVNAELVRIGRKAYFYLESGWWNGLEREQKEAVKDSLEELDSEFTRNIYPTLTGEYGSEPNPGVDGDERITVLFHPLKEDYKGYFREIDGYPSYQMPGSNEREMVYLSSEHLNHPLTSSYLAHEFAHLITFNQKNILRGVTEEVWLNEVRAEYAPTLLGYGEYEESNLAQRKETFLNNPTDPLTEWLGEEADYGALNIFTHYLVEKYGVEILRDSLQSEKKGIESINEALIENGYEETFGDVFASWMVAVAANDCELGENEKYCYENEMLSGLTVSPTVNFLPLGGRSSLGLNQSSKPWAGRWFKFVGGKKGALRINFIGNPDNDFKIPYLVRDFSGKYSVDFFELDEDQRGEILVSGFGSDISSVIIMPSVQTKTEGFNGEEETTPYFWEAATITEKEGLGEEEESSSYLQKPLSDMTREELIMKIEELKALLGQLEERLKGVAGEETAEASCGRIEEDLRVGIENDQVRCLQEFLKGRGEDIYPEGLVTGYFGPLTKKAVVRFQERWKEDVLAPWDLEQGTGFVGETTKSKINELMR